MRYLAVIPALYAAACFQTSLVEAMEIGRIAPDVLALLAAAIALLVGGSGGLAMVAAVGLVEDLLSPGRLGIATASYLLAGWTATELAERFVPRLLATRLLFTGLFTGVVACGVGLARCAIGEAAVGPWSVVGRGVGVAIYTAALAAPLWIAIGWIERRGDQRMAGYDL